MTSPADAPTPSPPTGDDTGPPSTPRGFRRFRQLTFHSVLAGLCPLVPVPFLDDWLLARVRRLLVADINRDLELYLSEEVRIILAGGRDGWRTTGCAAGCAWVLHKVVLRLIVKLSRKILYFLAVREGLHAATQVFHEGYLLTYALASDEPQDGIGGGARGSGARHPETARQLRRDVLATIEAMDLTPVRDTLRRGFRGSRRLLMRASRVLARPFLSRRRRRAMERAMEDEATARAAAEAVRAEEEALLGSLVDRLARTLWGNREYFARLEARFEARRREEGTERTEGA